MRLLSALVVALAALTSPAMAAEEVALRVGAHPGFGRVVFEWPAVVGYTVVREPGRLRVIFDRPGSFGQPALPRALPPPILGIQTEGGEAVILLAEGAAARHYRLDRRIVIDVSPAAQSAGAIPAPVSQAAVALPLPPPWPGMASDDRSEPSHPAATPDGRPAAAAVETAASRPEPAGAPAAAAAETGVRRDQAERSVVATELRAPQADGALSRAAGSATQAPGRFPGAGQPVSLLVRPLPDRSMPAMLLPFPAETGFAAFRRAGALWVVADEARPLDLRALRGHPTFGEAEVTITATATLLRLPNAGVSGLRLTRTQEGFELRVSAAEPASVSIRQEVGREGDRTDLRLRVSGAHRVLRLTDPETGERLLVGTLVGEGAAVGVGRAGPEFTLLPSERGVVVLAWSEAVHMRPTADGFRIEAMPQVPDGLALTRLAGSPDFTLASRAPTRSFDLPALPAEALAERLRLLRAEVAAAPPLGRSRPRLLLAETMLAAGLGAEAHALLLLAAVEDPQLAASPRWKALTGAAGLLAARLAEARALLFDPTIPETDELSLWRTWLAHEEGAPAAETAPRFAAVAPLIPAYPRDLSRRLAPAAVEAMVEGGEVAVAQALLRQFADWPELTLGRAMLHEQLQEIDQALDAYQRAAALRDRRQRAQALLRATELALREGRIGFAEAAARLEPLLYAWRGDAWERALRLRAADLRAIAGDWPGAMALLRETAELFPEASAAARERLSAAFASLFQNGAAEGLPPSQAITLFEENLDLLPAGPAGDEIVARFADRLVAFDLTSRAAALLARLMERQREQSLDRARTGLRLARLRLEDGDPAGALAALAASEPAGSVAGLSEERALIRARALAATAATREARDILRGLTHPAARELEAEMASAEGDWAEVASALTAMLREVAPTGASLDAAQRRLVLRAAVAATLAEDQTRLRWLRETYGPAMADGALSEPFRLLAADGAASSGNARQLAAELQLARSVQRSLAGGSSMTRN
ncbi:MAG: tetratricopeptide repeat protein [Elioraea sp.]|nr:tetratricopeptide repeat protein [Elioraea sp.]